MSFGQVLRAAREEQLLQLEDVQQRTFISVRNLRLLEDEDWQELPEDVHVKGYIRRYAKLLGLDGESLWKQALASRNRPLEPEIPILPLSPSTDSGDVRLRETTLQVTDAEPDGNEALPEHDLRVIAAALIQETEHPATRKKPKARHLPPLLEGMEREGPEERAPGAAQPEPRDMMSEASPNAASQAPHQPLTPMPQMEEHTREFVPAAPPEVQEVPNAARTPADEIQHPQPEQALLVPGVKQADRLKKREELSKRQLQIRRRRLGFSLAFWTLLVAALLGFIFRYDSGRILQQIKEWISSDNGSASGLLMLGIAIALVV